MELSILANLLSRFLSSRQQALVALKSHEHDASASDLGDAMRMFEAGDFAGAVMQCKELIDASGGDEKIGKAARDIQFNACIEAARRHFPGPDYFNWLNWFHQTLNPSTYLEIGVESGRSLQFAQEPTRAVGVDPALKVVHSQQAWVKLFQLTSDDFFATRDLRHVLDADTVDFAFIDGLHTFDQALKDFINIERFAHRGTVAVFHDIYPVVPLTAQRERVTQFWLGDTWKVIMILRKYRPDLNVFTIPTYPSGLGVASNLDPTSTILSDRFDRICEEVMELSPEACLTDANSILGVVPNSHEEVRRLLKL